MLSPLCSTTVVVALPSWAIRTPATADTGTLVVPSEVFICH